MKIEELNIGDVVYAARDIIDDGSMPNGQEGALLSKKGDRGVLVQIGHLEELPTTAVFLVRFEDKDLNLGNPIGCFTEDLSVSP